MNDTTMDAFSAILAGAADILDIPADVRDAAVARYTDVGTFLAETGGETWSVYPQGSFSTGTAIRPPTNAGEYDIDLVFRNGIRKESTSQAELKERVGTMLEQYHEYKTSTDADDAPDKYFEKRRCWTLAYDSLGFHLDVLPSIPDDDFVCSGNAILLTDTKLRPWQHGNPKDYAVWFRDRSEEMLRKLRFEAKTRKVDVAAVPDWMVRSTLQRLVQVLKWHCYLAFADDLDDRPPSILITTLAAHAYGGQEDLGTALIEAVHSMETHIHHIDGRWEVLNPAHPGENFTDKWNDPDTAHRRTKFRAWLGTVQTDLERAHKTRDAGIDTLVDNLSGPFDRDILTKSAANWANRTVELREQGKLSVAAGTAVLSAGAGRRSRSHVFHGRETR